MSMKNSITKQKDIDWNRMRLGTKPDSYYANKYKVSVSNVAQARQRRGIPACSETPTLSEAKRRGIDWDKVKLGTKPDTVIARQLNVSVVSVCLQRKKRNIPAFVCPSCGR